VEVEIVLHKANVGTKLPFISPDGDCDVVLILEGHIMNLRRTLRRRSNRKVSVDDHICWRDTGRIVGVYVRETEGGLIRRIIGNRELDGGPIRRCAELIDPAALKGVRPGERSDLISPDTVVPSCERKWSLLSLIVDHINGGEEITIVDVVGNVKDALILIDGHCRR